MAFNGTKMLDAMQFPENWCLTLITTDSCQISVLRILCVWTFLLSAKAILHIHLLIQNYQISILNLQYKYDDHLNVLNIFPFSYNVFLQLQQVSLYQGFFRFDRPSNPITHDTSILCRHTTLMQWCSTVTSSQFPYHLQ